MALLVFGSNAEAPDDGGNARPCNRPSRCGVPPRYLGFLFALAATRKLRLTGEWLRQLAEYIRTQVLRSFGTMAIGPRRRRYTEGRGAIDIIKDSCVTRRNDPHAPVPPLSADASRLEKAIYCTRRSQPAVIAASFAVLFVIAAFGESSPRAPAPPPAPAPAPARLTCLSLPLRYAATAHHCRRRGGAS